MKKQIQDYIKFIDGELTRIKSGESDELAALAELNERMIGNFRHERTIHLVITLFFAVMTVLWFMVTLTLIIIGPTDYLNPYMVILLGILTALFMIVDVFYIRHYFFLENNIQKLYKYDMEIYSLRC